MDDHIDKINKTAHEMNLETLIIINELLSRAYRDFIYCIDIENINYYKGEIAMLNTALHKIKNIDKISEKD